MMLEAQRAFHGLDEQDKNGDGEEQHVNSCAYDVTGRALSRYSY